MTDESSAWSHQGRRTPKIVMYSEYERVKDHRSFGDRRTVFSGPLYMDEYQRISPSQRIVMTEAGFKVGNGEVHGSHGEPEGSETPIEVVAE
ncbi:unnamed protein product [Protopolystoma xenopodis]|uniref:Uncharacterized protein n=1 Tax=Protopolystoma xenopodis TaxID=117903 RepID=A0A448WTQ0_9PLAT|nr:unnamed protein product [Protopolystoma xenopodis]